MTEILPEGAVDVYYRDEIGNISTSNLADTDRGVTLQIQVLKVLFMIHC
jgi:oligosaccharyltransferase complex subunit alpha (ribophorin I)